MEGVSGEERRGSGNLVQNLVCEHAPLCLFQLDASGVVRLALGRFSFCRSDCKDGLDKVDGVVYSILWRFT